MKTFRGWLSERIDEPTPIGDLARDAFSDSEWKGRASKSLRLELERCNACDGAFSALDNAVRLYEMYKSGNNSNK